MANDAKTSPHVHYRNGIPQMPVRPGAGRATLELVQQILEQEDIDYIRNMGMFKEPADLKDAVPPR